MSRSSERPNTFEIWYLEKLKSRKNEGAPEKQVVKSPVTLVSADSQLSRSSQPESVGIPVGWPHKAIAQDACCVVMNIVSDHLCLITVSFDTNRVIVDIRKTDDHAGPVVGNQDARRIAKHTVRSGSPWRTKGRGIVWSDYSSGRLNADGVTPDVVIQHGRDPALPQYSRTASRHVVSYQRRGHVRVADFGLAVASAHRVDRITKTGAFMGTPLFMSPEQFAGHAKTLGPDADVWALRSASVNETPGLQFVPM